MIKQKCLDLFGVQHKVLPFNAIDAMYARSVINGEHPFGSIHVVGRYGYVQVDSNWFEFAIDELPSLRNGLKLPQEITLSDWLIQFDPAAKKQGWSLFDADGIIAIQRIDVQGDRADSDEEARIINETHTQLTTDEEAYRAVLDNLTLTGNKIARQMSLLALWLDGRIVRNQSAIKKWKKLPPEMKHYIPPQLREHS